MDHQLANDISLIKQALGIGVPAPSKGDDREQFKQRVWANMEKKKLKRQLRKPN